MYDMYVLSTHTRADGNVLLRFLHANKLNLLFLNNTDYRPTYKKKNKYSNTSGFRRQTAEVGWYSELRSPSSDTSVSRPVVADICCYETGNQDTATRTSYDIND